MFKKFKNTFIFIFKMAYKAAKNGINHFSSEFKWYVLVTDWHKVPLKRNILKGIATSYT